MASTIEIFFCYAREDEELREGLEKQLRALKRQGIIDVWHDRAVLHFLTAPRGRAAYRRLLAQTLPVGGHAVIGSFALDGPEKCSGLEVQRYDGPMLALELGPQFSLVKSEPEIHMTPWGKPQSFQFSLFKRV